MLDEKKKQAIVAAVKKRLDAGAGDGEILEALSGLGVSEEDALQIMKETGKALPGPARVTLSKETIVKIEQMIEALKAENKLDTGAPFRTYIPKLRTGGRKGITEIIAESRIGK